MEDNNEISGKKSKVVQLKHATQKEKKKPEKIASAPSKKGMSGLFVTDDRFRYALELIRKDMNTAFTLTNTSSSNYYFLLKFLIEKEIIDKDEFETFIKTEIENMEEQKSDD